ncbi:MAG: hypothetical protein ISR01_03725 [Chitinophagales bacterium]|nr:hypothetical protein [Chitinophagales bacterium]MDC3209792.1 hypothetical protein [Chitinophagales bacterium]|tara:strand:- start:839 stop:1300 length:462 start_codon:yes stop_codon:yes gene_type:complete
MKNFLKIFLLIFLVISSCKAKKAVSETAEGDETIELLDLGNKMQSFQIGEIDEPVKEDLMFVIKDLTILEKKVEIKVQYGGGCVKPHVFELYTDGVLDKTGNMDFYLLHKTHSDYCKALIMETLVFDLNPLYDLQSQKLKTIRINDLRKNDMY